MHRRLLRFYVALALVVPLATTTAIAAPAAPPTGLKGQITDFRGTAMKDASVTVWKDAGQAAAPTVSTDANGRYVIPRLKAGEYLLQVEPRHGRVARTTYSGRKGSSDKATSVFVVPNKMTAANIRMLAAGTVTGKVLDHRGRPLPNVTVESDGLAPLENASFAVGARPVSWTTPESTETDRNGSFSLSGLPQGKQKLRLSFNTYTVTKNISVKPGASVSIGRVKLPKFSGSIRGKINLSNTAMGESAAILLDAAGNQIDFEQTNGLVRFNGLAPGNYTVLVYGTGISRKVTVKAGKTTVFPTITGKLSTLTGKLKTTRNDVYYSVTAFDRFGRSHAQYIRGGRTYTLRGLGTGAYKIQVRATSYTPKSSPFGVNEVVSDFHTIKIAKSGRTYKKNLTHDLRGRTVSGKILNPAKGSPARSVSVWVEATTKTASQMRGYYVKKDGTFSIPGLGSARAHYTVHDKFNRVLRQGVIKAGKKPVKLGTLRLS